MAGKKNAPGGLAVGAMDRDMADKKSAPGGLAVGAIDLMAIAPFFLRRLQVYIDISIADIWRLQAQRVIAQQSPEDDSELTEREARPKKRGLLTRFTG